MDTSFKEYLQEKTNKQKKLHGLMFPSNFYILANCKTNKGRPQTQGLLLLYLEASALSF